ncbi:MAG: hypothetical protein EXR64_04205 [Dehalococcoidia bacterium]|nr:hypothetical protein [Dehalococcoidia bacterium]
MQIAMQIAMRVRALTLPSLPSFAALLALLASVAVVACGGTGPRAARPAAGATPEVAPPASIAAPGSATPATPLAPASPTARRVPVVVLDPGHAVDEAGAAAFGVVEKESNLDFAVRVAGMLRERGIEVILTRTADVRAAAPGEQPTREQGYNGTRLDLQARIDLANAARADVFVSLHSNGAPDPEVRGYEVYYNAARPFANESRTLARLLLDGVSTEMRASGYPAMARGAFDDACLKAFQGRCFPLMLLGPSRVTAREEVYRRGGTPEGLGFAPGKDAITLRPTQMPGALVELLFISSPADVALLRDDGARNAMARGVARGVTDFLAQSAQPVQSKQGG